jgi:nucleoside-diphosphate-sugar epimerase
MQTILGAGGVIATEIAKALPSYTSDIRLVSRRPQPVLGNEDLVPADLLNLDQTRQAVAGSNVVYLTVGLPYNTKLWTQAWPVIMANVLQACIEAGAKLVFFDNVYLFGKQTQGMTEETPVQPCSEKGKVRAKVVQMIESRVEQGKLEALIARSADFYGPGATNSPINMLVIETLKAGKKPSWMGKAKLPHSLTYTPDAGKATALLGNSAQAYNQSWHLPTAHPALTGEQYIQLAASIAGVSPKYRTISRGMMKMAGWFNAMVRSSVEMMYQFEQPYFFDSSKFEQVFGVEATAYEEAFGQLFELQKTPG